ncbi:MAG: hypothetical protein HQ594_04445 [Candidatus Omnitrophica bacterium]|nr:hypothetical protein [Candidatus Omnitrophota bacterium]
MNGRENLAPAVIPKGRLILGITIFAIGQATTLLIPFVAASDLSTNMKTFVSTMFFFVTPQIGIVWSIAVLGKAGYEYLKKKVFSWLKRHAPPEVVSPLRYRIGLILFIVPILFGWFAPYGGHRIPGYEVNRVAFGAVGDMMFIFSFFVLGGEFWDKIRALFVRRAKVQFE